jgi:hypothetical protein
VSIKGFHLIFICVAAIFCGALGVWATFLNDVDQSLGTKIFGGFALISAVGLLAYARYFWRKSRSIIV